MNYFTTMIRYFVQILNIPLFIKCLKLLDTTVRFLFTGTCTFVAKKIYYESHYNIWVLKRFGKFVITISRRAVLRFKTGWPNDNFLNPAHQVTFVTGYFLAC